MGGVFRLCTVGIARPGNHTPLRNSIIADTESRFGDVANHPAIGVAVGSSNTHH